MFRKTFSAVLMVLLFLSMIILAFNVRPAEAVAQSVNINADGSITPAGAPIMTSDKITYTFTGDISYPVYSGIVVLRSNVIIDGKGYTVQGDGSGEGVYLTNISNVTIKNTNVKSNYYGIYLYSSSSNIISGINMTANVYFGIYLGYSSNNSISGNNIRNGTGTISPYGNGGIVLLSSCNYNSISGNNITNNVCGIVLDYSSCYNSISENNLKNNDDGIELSDSSNHNRMSGNNITNKHYGVFLVTSYNNTISGNNIRANIWGIGLEFGSSYNSIRENNITNNSGDGVDLGGSSYNSISGNNMTNNAGGIWLWSTSCYNSISGNNMTNIVYGIQLSDGSNGNSISQNAFIGDGLFVWGSYRSSVDNNTVNSKPLVYLEDMANYSVGDAGQVTLVGCDGIRVENLNLSRATVGVQLWGTKNSIVSRNNMTNNVYNGIMLSYSSNNSISGNNIANNAYGTGFDVPAGIGLFYSSSNIIYHNNFINNPSQVYSYQSYNNWDNGYPSGGNYWSNDAVADAYHGVYQNLTGGDGIRDKPYTIDANNKDNYPLAKPYPWGSHDIGLTYIGEVWETYFQPIILPLKTIIGLGFKLQINVFVMNYGAYREVFNTTIYANTTAIDTITNIILVSRNSIILNFTWDTTGLARCSYTISAFVTPVPGETDTSDNALIGGKVLVTKPGDVNGDSSVDVLDLIIVAKALGTYPGDPKYNPNADINGEGDIDVLDLLWVAKYLGT
jgi:parallel beta-helix repeat protein